MTRDTLFADKENVLLTNILLSDEGKKYFRRVVNLLQQSYSFAMYMQSVYANWSEYRFNICYVITVLCRFELNMWNPNVVINLVADFLSYNDARPSEAHCLKQHYTYH